VTGVTHIVIKTSSVEQLAARRRAPSPARNIPEKDQSDSEHGSVQYCRVASMPSRLVRNRSNRPERSEQGRSNSAYQHFITGRGVGSGAQPSPVSPSPAVQPPRPGRTPQTMTGVPRNPEQR
jgi:hypothetical protein